MAIVKLGKTSAKNASLLFLYRFSPNTQKQHHLIYIQLRPTKSETITLSKSNCHANQILYYPWNTNNSQWNYSLSHKEYKGSM